MSFALPKSSISTMKITSFLVIAILVFTSGNEVSAKPSSLGTLDDKIVGGYNVSIEEVPYQALLTWEQKDNNVIKEYYCGGVIINTRYILTAAHCLLGVPSLRVMIGSSIKSRKGNYESANTIIHPKYDSTFFDYDVALVKLKQDMKLDGKSTKAAKLAEANSVVPDGTTLLASGWGATEDGGTGSNLLLAVKVPTISRAKCAILYKNVNRITDRMICAGSPQGGKGTCKGDSGGPALSLQTNEVVGLTSFGVGCGRPEYPGVYTNVAAVRSWIDVNSKV